MGLRACHVETFLGSTRDMHEEIGVCLIAWTLAPITFGVGHAGAHNQIAFLCFFQEVDITLVVARTV